MKKYLVGHARIMKIFDKSTFKMSKIFHKDIKPEPNSI